MDNLRISNSWIIGVCLVVQCFFCLPQLQRFLGLEEIRHLVEVVFALADVLDFDDDGFSLGLKELEHVVHESFYFLDEGAVALFGDHVGDTSEELEELLEVASLIF